MSAGTDGVFLRPLLTDSEGRLVTTQNVVSQLPSFSLFDRKVLASGATSYKQYTMTENTAVKEFHIGGRVSCEGFMAKYSPATISMISGFNSPSEVSQWTNTSSGSSATPSWTYATDQFLEGTGSAKLTFTQSDGNNFPEITRIFSTPLDMSGWRYVSASARVTVAGGGSQNRTIQIRLTSGTAIRIWNISGTTTTAPFNVEQWLTINGEIELPTSTAGSGIFDINNVGRISLRLQDGGNKSGSIWWDDVKLYASIDVKDKIYSADGTTNQIMFDPISTFLTGETLLVAIKNTSSISGEVQAAASGVSI